MYSLCPKLHVLDFSRMYLDTFKCWIHFYLNKSRSTNLERRLYKILMLFRNHRFASNKQLKYISHSTKVAWTLKFWPTLGVEKELDDEHGGATPPEKL